MTRRTLVGAAEPPERRLNEVTWTWDSPESTTVTALVATGNAHPWPTTVSGTHPNAQLHWVVAGR